MEFMKKSRKYMLEYKTREDAAKALGEDPRVKEVKIIDYCDHRRDTTEIMKYLIVETNPIQPKQIKPGFEKMVIGPVGQYFIWLKQIKDCNNLTIRIERKFGPVCMDMIQPHVHTTSWESICWGSIQEDIGKVKEYGDWYWAIKYALDLIEDWNDEEIHELTFALYFFFSQLNTNPKLRTQLVKHLQKIYDDGEEFYEEYHGGGRGEDHQYDSYEYFRDYGIGNPEPREIEEARLRKERELESANEKSIRDYKDNKEKYIEKARRAVEHNNIHPQTIQVGDRIIMTPDAGYGVTTGGTEGIVKSIRGKEVHVVYDVGCHGEFDVSIDNMVKLP